MSLGTGLQEAVQSLADELAEAISSRDVAGASRHVREDGHVVFVSGGTVIRGTEYREALARFYATRSQLKFEWERHEVRGIGSRVAVLTGWAKIHAVDQAGTVSDTRAIVTLVFAQDGFGGWELVTVHKTTVS